MSQDYQAMTGLELLPGGRWFNPLDVGQRRKVIVLGYSKAAHLFNPEQEGSWFSSVKLQVDPVGRKRSSSEEGFVVIGVLKKAVPQLSKATLLITLHLCHLKRGGAFTLLATFSPLISSQCQVPIDCV